MEKETWQPLTSTPPCSAPPETSLDYLSKHTSAAKSKLLEIDLDDNEMQKYEMMDTW